MPNKSKSECVKQEVVEGMDDQKERGNVVADSTTPSKYDVDSLRKAALSKREIMEELSRQRFPWDE
jgi:hypothetical protein